jgi:hypothetical protein
MNPITTEAASPQRITVTWRGERDEYGVSIPEWEGDTVVSATAYDSLASDHSALLKRVEDLESALEDFCAIDADAVIDSAVRILDELAQRNFSGEPINAPAKTVDELESIRSQQFGCRKQARQGLTRLRL